VSKNLDEIDLKILAEIQADGRITNVELAKRVGISPPPCLRRVRTLEEEGYIQGYRGLLDPRRLGFDVTVFASVHLSSQADADLRAFEDFVRSEPLVRECWMLSGEVDFILRCVARDLPDVEPVKPSTPEPERMLADASDAPAVADREVAEALQAAADSAANGVVVGPRVPDFKGMTLSAVLRECVHLGLELESVGRGLARGRNLRQERRVVFVHPAGDSQDRGEHRRRARLHCRDGERSIARS
jgi:DNA-binding Lrp family transcriptional regulator